MSFKTLPSSSTIKTEHYIPSSKQLKLLAQIHQSKQKLVQLQSIENQVKQLAKNMQKTESVSKISASNQQKEYNETTKMSAKITDRRKVANLKFRIYELQRKLHKLKSENQIKRQVRGMKSQELQNIVKNIMTMESKFLKATKQADQTDKNIQDLQISTLTSLKSLQEQQQKHSKETKTINLYSFQVRRLKDLLNLLKKKIGQRNDSTQPLQHSSFDSINLNFSREEQSLLIPIGSKLKRKQSDNFTMFGFQDLIKQQSCQSFVQIPIQELQINRQQLKNINMDFFDQLQALQIQREQIQKQSIFVQQQFLRVQSLKKHRLLTRNLMEQQLKSVQTGIFKLNQEIDCNNIYSEQIASQLSQIQGARGQLRAKIGIQIQQHQLAMSVNSRLNRDWKKLVQLTNELRDYWRQSKRISQNNNSFTIFES